MPCVGLMLCFWRCSSRFCVFFLLLSVSYVWVRAWKSTSLQTGPKQQGTLTWEKEETLTALRRDLYVDPARHQAEMALAAADERLAWISIKCRGYRSPCACSVCCVAKGWTRRGWKGLGLYRERHSFMIVYLCNPGWVR